MLKTEITLLDSKLKLNPTVNADPWFFTNCSINPYRGCQFNCSYCDGKASYYNIPEFGSVIRSKNNFPRQLERELVRLGYERQSGIKQSSLNSFIGKTRTSQKPKKFVLSVGGGVTDCYQPVEKEKKVMRDIIKVLIDFEIPCFFLTKSTLIERDLDLIGELNDRVYASVNFSIANNDKNVKKIFEPNVPSVHKRFETLDRFTSSGITGGLLAMPLLPFITDTDETIEYLVRKAKECKSSYILTAGLTLKPGNREEFLKKICQYYPSFLDQYKKIFPENNTFGAPVINKDLVNVIAKAHLLTRRCEIHPRIRRFIPEGFIDVNLKLTEHLWYIHYLRKWVLEENNPFFDKEFKKVSSLIEYLDQPISSNLIDEKSDLSSKIGNYFKKIIFDFIEFGDSQERKKLELRVK